MLRLLLIAIALVTVILSAGCQAPGSFSVGYTDPDGHRLDAAYHWQGQPAGKSYVEPIPPHAPDLSQFFPANRRSPWQNQRPSK